MSPRRRKRDSDLPARVYRKHGAYYLVTTANKWVRLGKGLDEALARHQELTEGRSRRGSTLGHIFDRYAREIVPTKAPRTQRDNLRELTMLRQAFGHMLADHVTAQDIYGYMDARQAPVRANREKSLLSHVYSHAIRWGLAADNPVRLVRSNPERPRDRYVTDAEVQAVLDVASPAVRVAVLLSVITGLRQGDILALRWDAVTADGLQVRQGKTGRVLLFEWTPELRAILDDARRLQGEVMSLHVVQTRTGQRYTANGFGSVWKRAIERAKLKQTFRFHDLRAKSASDHQTGEHLGHLDGRTLQRVYRRAPLKVTPLRPKILEG